MPPRSGKSGTQGGWRAIALSILLHSAIVAAAVYGWFTWKHRPPPTETLAIEATVVDERALKGIATKPEPAPEPPPPEPAPPEPEPEPVPVPVEEQGPPKPDPAEIERKEQERLAAEKAEQEKKTAQELKEREEAQLEAEKQAAAKVAAQKAAQEKAAADKKALEKKRAEDAAAAKKAAEDKARAAKQEELRRAIEAEERGNAARNSDDAMRWHAQIVARIQQKWIKPASAPAGISCIVSVTQVPGGEVTNVRVNSCSIDDAAFRESVEAAVYRATPLPMPPAGVPFERNLELTFAPRS